MEITFEGVWADFRKRLKPRTLIKSWSINGYTGGKFGIEALDGGSITVVPQNGKPRAISKADFGRMHAFWSAYKAGTIGRAELVTKSQNTTYILSLFHWLEASES